MIAALVFKVPNVPIWATLASPYFLRTYSITSYRRAWHRSISMSGRLGTIGVEETLEEQVVFQRADVAQMEQITDKGAAGRSAGRGRNALFARISDEVPDDQKVRREPHPVDDRKLVLQTVESLAGRIVAVALAQTGLAKLAQIIFGALGVGRLKRRETAAAQAQAFIVRLDQLGDSRRGGQGLFVAWHGLVHLVGAA